MNLLRRHVEMPKVIWKDDSLSSDEKVLLAIVYSLGQRDGIVLRWMDIAETLQLPMSAADNLIEHLSRKGVLLIFKDRGQRCWMQFGCRLMEAIDHERMAPKVQLKMCFIQCLCEYDLKMDHVEQIRVCPECRRVVFFTQANKKYMSRRRSQTRGI